MIPRPPRSTRTDTLFPYTTLTRLNERHVDLAVSVVARVLPSDRNRPRHKVGLLPLCFAQPAAKRHSSVATRKSENCALPLDNRRLTPIATHRPRLGRQRHGRQRVRRLAMWIGHTAGG